MRYPLNTQHPISETMKKTLILAVASVAVMLLGSCGTKHPVVTLPSFDESRPVVTELPTEVPAYPNANKEFASVKDAADVVLGRTDLKALASKYGYKTLVGYAVYRLDSYDTMLYKNCLPAKKVGQGVYTDTPQPQRKGTSSYVAVTKDVTIGVFNNKAYENLVEQVKNSGFRLLEQGYEDHYTNGLVDAYCYASRRTVRLSKAENQ